MGEAKDQDRHVALAQQRQTMLDRQLRERGITDQRLLDAMDRVHREDLVPEHLANHAYEDAPLPIGYGQTISQPFTVALMCWLLDLKATDKVLEVGTGSGYGAAVLSQLAGTVFTIERIPALAETAEKRLAQLGYSNVEVRAGDGSPGLPEEAAFDGIVVTAGAEGLPEVHLQQLVEGGRIVIPLGTSKYGQSLFRITRRSDELLIEDLGAFAFVPLIGKYAWKSS